MLIDCDTCAVRGHGCADCVMTVLLGAPPAGVELDATEQAAIGALAEHGLVPPLRLVPVAAKAVGSGAGVGGGAGDGSDSGEGSDARVASDDTLRLSCVRATG
jgi:hypothetical protein